MPDDVSASRTTPLVATLRRHLGLIAALTVAGLVIGILVGALQPKSYTAESRVFLSSQSSFDALGGDFATDPSRYLDQQAGVMTSRPLLAEALERGASAQDVEELQQAVEVLASAESDVLTVRATASGPEDAVARVENVIAAFQDYQTELVKAQLEAVESVSNAGERRLAQQRAAVFGDGVQLVETASVTASTSVIRNATVLALAGLLLGLAIAFARDARRSTQDRAARRQRRALQVAAGWPLPDDGHDPALAADLSFARRSPEPEPLAPVAPGNLRTPENVRSTKGVRSVERSSGTT